MCFVDDGVWVKTEGKVMQSRIDPCEICGKRVTVNTVLCTNGTNG